MPLQFIYFRRKGVDCILFAGFKRKRRKRIVLMKKSIIFEYYLKAIINN